MIGFIFNFAITKSFSQSRNTKEFDESTFQIISVDKGIEYKSVESTYKTFYKFESEKSDYYYLARYKTTTIKNLSQEGQDRTIEVTVSPLNKLSLVKYKIKQDCDQLDLFNDYYKTIKYGCCLLSTEVRLFDYSNNLIIEGSERIFIGNIYNNRTDFYFSYKSPTDTLSLGQINFWFSNNEKYQILLKSIRSTVHDGLEECPVLYPKIDMIMNDNVSFDNEETYTFGLLKDIKSSSEINFSFTLTFDCDSTILPITIPIINGKPFGRNSENQICNVEYK